MLDAFDEVIRGADPASDAQLDDLAATLGNLLGLDDAFVLPRGLSHVLRIGITVCVRRVEGRYIELGWLGLDMGDFVTEYEFGEYMPGALPVALDGGGGFYCLDTRTAPNDGMQPVVWSHSGNLGWRADEVRAIAADFESLLSDARAG